MKQAGEVVLANQLRQLIVGAVVSGGQSREGGRIQPWSVSHSGHELPRPVDEERAA
jgi:hypothetical protein